MGPGARSSQKETMPPPTRSLRSRTATVSSAATGSTASGSSSGTPSTRTHPGPASVSSRPLSEVLPPPPSLNLARKDETTPEQRRAIWQKRITLMADATQEYLDLGKLEQDVQSRRRQVQSPAFDALSSDVKTAFQASLRNAEATYERKMGSLNSAIGKLSETDFWPPVPSQKIGDVEAKLRDAKTLLGGLADNVGQLYKRIETLYGQHSAGRSGPSSSGAKAASGDGDTRAKKRRRLSDNDNDNDNDDDNDDGDSTDVPTVAAAPAPPDMREDVESIRDIIREIEDRLQEVENDMTQHSRHIVEQLETTMDEKIEEVARSADIAALVEAQLAPRTAQTIRVFDETLAHTDQEIAELAQEMAELVPRLAELQRDNDLVQQEDAGDKELLAQLVKADQDNAQAITRLQEEARTLRSALTAAHSKRALPPAPAMPPSGTFLEALKGSIAKQTRTEIERIAKTRDAELYEKLRDRLEQSSKMSQLISAWIERDPDDARQVLAAAAATAQNGGAGGSGSALT
ncbi:hypothetical protein BC826DRAFT_966100 [Russula brevipes]|nr:hypothetical protein BC826DRAFT_966100 [Russula brevipes]